MTTTADRIAAAYEIAKAVFHGALPMEAGARHLRDEHGFNVNTARDYIENYRRMRAGASFHRTINLSAADYFLSRIGQEDGEHLAAAIDAISKHIEYYEGIRSIRLPSLRKIVDKHRARLGSPLSLADHMAAFDRQVERSSADSPAARAARLLAAPKIPAKIKATTDVFVRNADVVAEVLHRAKGTCEHCEKPAPFLRRKDGAPYLEVHHLKPLSEGGEDTVANAVALCPNCHRQKHHGAPNY